jgi:IclR family acetate operon transcriptional repressor
MIGVSGLTAAMPPMPPMPPSAFASAVRPTRTVDRALALLAEVCSSDRVSLADCARSTDLPASTALRLLRTLESSGFVHRDPAGSFHPGPRMIQLGALAYGRQSLVAEAEPAMRRIVSECGESTYLAVPGTTGTALYVGMVEGTFSVRHTSWVGRTVPLDGTAVGAAMAGWTGPDGFVALRSAVEQDVSAVAAPVRRAGVRTAAGHPGPVVGVLCVVGPSYRLDENRLSAVGMVVSREAGALSQRFGTDAEASAS